MTRSSSAKVQSINMKLNSFLRDLPTTVRGDRNPPRCPESPEVSGIPLPNRENWEREHVASARARPGHRRTRVFLAYKRCV